MTDPYDVFWHRAEVEGVEQIVARVPQIGNEVVQGTTFDEVRAAVRTAVVQFDGRGITTADVTVGAFQEETESDFVEAAS